MFRSAYEGIKRIYTAQLIALVSAIALLITVIIGFASLSANAGSSDAALASIGLIAIFASIALIAAFILNLVGLVKAKQDERSFDTALMFTILGIVVSVIGGFFGGNDGGNETVSGIFNICSEIVSLLVTIFVVKGIVSIAEQVNDNQVAAKGRSLLKVIICVQLIGIIASIVSVALGGESTIANILLIASSIASIVYYIMYLLLLAKAIKMLEQ